MSLKDYIQKHNIESLMQEAVNVLTASMPDTPIKSLETFFRSQSPSEIIDICANEIINIHGEISILCKVSTHKGTFSGTSSFAKSSSMYENLETREPALVIFDINEKLKPALVGKDPRSQQEIDLILSEYKSKNMMAVSIAILKAGASESNTPLHKYVQNLGNFEEKIPKSMIHLFKTDSFQSVMAIVPTEDLHDNITSLKIFSKSGNIENYKEYTFEICVDMDASDFFAEKSLYNYKDELIPTEKLSTLYSTYASRYNLFSIDDPYDQDDIKSYENLKANLDTCKVIGTDIFGGNYERIEKYSKCVDYICISPYQYTTLTEFIDTVTFIKKQNIGIVFGTRTCDCDDSFLSDLSTGIAADFARFGPLNHNENTCKYNRLIQIVTELNSNEL